MEKLFNGAIIEMQIVLKGQGTMIIKHTFTNTIKKHYMEYLDLLSKH